MIVLCGFTWSSSQRLDSICSLVGGNIGEFYTSEYNIRDYFLFLYAYFIPPLAVFSVHFCIVSHFLGFSCHFFSICYMFYLHFLGKWFNKKWSVDVSEGDVRSVSSTHCFNVLFGNFEQVIVSWRKLLVNLVSYWVNLVVFIVVLIQLNFFDFLFLF